MISDKFVRDLKLGFLSGAGRRTTRTSINIDLCKFIRLPRKIVPLFAMFPIQGIQSPVISIPCARSYCVKRKAFETIIKDFGRYTSPSKIVTTNNEIYYGCRGAIFDSKFNPLFLVLLKVSEDVDYTIDDVYIFISPLVFKNPTKVVEKGILTKLLPFIGENLSTVFTNDYGYMLAYGWNLSPNYSKANIIISDNIPLNFISGEEPINDNNNGENDEILNDYLCSMSNIVAPIYDSMF